MNGPEQRQRHLAVHRAEQRLDDMELVLVRMATELVHEREGYAKAIAQERTHRLTLADEQRAYVDGELRKLSARLFRCETQTVWQRLRWIVRGA